VLKVSQRKIEKKEQSATTVVSSILLYYVILQHVSAFIEVYHEEYIKYLQK